MKSNLIAIAYLKAVPVFSLVLGFGLPSRLRGTHIPKGSQLSVIAAWLGIKIKDAYLLLPETEFLKNITKFDNWFSVRPPPIPFSNQSRGK